MAVYKVIQDIEAEDKLLGPLTLRQFVYAGVSVLFFYLTFLVSTKGAAFMAVIFLPLALASGFFAWPWSRDQPTEIWALAKIRFLVKPRRRIWNQMGVKELVTITAPRKVQTVYTNNLSQAEVESRLKALAETIDTRGWAIKNINVNMYQQQQPQQFAAVPSSDRLIDMATMPQQVPEFQLQPTEDVLEDSNPIAQQFDSMIAASTKAHREDILENLRHMDTPQPAPPANQATNATPQSNYWFLNQPSAGDTTVPQRAVTFNTQVVSPATQTGPQNQPIASPNAPSEQIDEAALIEQLHEQDRMRGPSPYGRLHTIQPLAAQPPQGQYDPAGNGIPAFVGQSVQQPANTQQPQVTPQPDPAILQLASNDDLNVATIARQANKRKEELRDEVVISLH